MCSAENDGKKKKLVLVVDDDVDFTRAAELILSNGGYDTAVVHSGEDCRQYLLNNKPDAILLDMMMETWSEGSNVATHLRSSPETRHIPIILASAVDFTGPSTGMAETEAAIEVDGYMTKPIEPEKLLKQLSAVIEAAANKSG